MAGNWSKSVSNLAKCMSDIEYYEAILRNVFDGFYPGYWKNRRNKFETFKLFMRHYAFNIKHFTLEDLYEIDVDKFYSEAKLYEITKYYFEGKFTLFFFKVFTEMSFSKCKRLPVGFWDNESNIIYMIKCLIEEEYCMNDNEIKKYFTDKFVKDAGYGAILQRGYNCYELLKLCYPNRFKLEELKASKFYSNVDYVVIGCLKLFISYSKLLSLELEECTKNLIHKTFARLCNKLESIYVVHNLKFSELKNYTIQYKKEYEINEDILNLISEEEKEEIKKKYAEYLKEKNNKQINQKMMINSDNYQQP